MKQQLKLLLCYLLISAIVPIHLAFADGPVDRAGDGIHIDDIVYYLSQTGSQSSSDIRDLLQLIVPIITPTPDTMAPVLTLTGNATVSLENGANYTDMGATATDDTDGTLTGNIVVTISNNVNAETTLNTSIAGNYTYRFNVSDKAGNHALEVTRTVVVADVTPSTGSNIAIGAAASALTTYPGYSAARINDGSINTNVGEPYSWTNGEGVSLPQGVQLDWGMNKTFNRVELYTSTGYEIRDYQIQYWNGTSWVDLFTAVTGNTSAHRTHTFTAVTGSKIRVLGNSGPNGQPQYVRVNELEVY